MDAPNDISIKLENYGAFEIFYEHTVTDEQSGKFARWMDELGHIGKHAVSALLRKEGAEFVLHMPMKDGIPRIAALVNLGADITEGLADVFARSPVEVLLCDRQLGALKVVNEWKATSGRAMRTMLMSRWLVLGDLGDAETDGWIFHFCTSSSVGGFGTMSGSRAGKSVSFAAQWTQTPVRSVDQS